MIAALLVWLAIGNFTSTLQVDTRGLSIATVADAQFDDYVSLDGNVVPIQVVQISPEEGGVVVEKVVDEGSRVHKGDVIVRLSNSNLDLEILNAESELAEKQKDLLLCLPNLPDEQVCAGGKEQNVEETGAKPSGDLAKGATQLARGLSQGQGGL